MKNELSLRIDGKWNEWKKITSYNDGFTEYWIIVRVHDLHPACLEE